MSPPGATTNYFVLHEWNVFYDAPKWTTVAAAGDKFVLTLLGQSRSHYDAHCIDFFQGFFLLPHHLQNFFHFGGSMDTQE